MLLESAKSHGISVLQMGAVPLGGLGGPNMDPTMGALGMPGPNMNPQVRNAEWCVYRRHDFVIQPLFKVFIE